MKITQKLVREYTRYSNGKLFWRVSPAQRCKVDSEVGCLNPDGYRQVSFRGIQYRVHRLVFLYHYGYLPENQLDHINRIRDDNRIENLREVSASCNTRNSGTRSDNTSGIKGVHYNKASKKWEAQIRINGKMMYLGRHTTKLEAACHRLAAEQCLNWQACDSNSPAYKYIKENL